MVASTVTRRRRGVTTVNNLVTTIVQPVGFYPQDLRPVCRDSEAVRVIVHKLIVGSVNRKDRWVPLAFEDMASLVGERTWKRLKKAVIGSHVAECDEVYEIGSRSMRYRLLAPWCDAGHEQYVLRDADLARRLTVLESRDSGRDRWEPVHASLEDRLRALRVDEGPIRRLICRLDSRRQCRAKLSVELIQSGDPRMKLSQYGRVYSAATGCPRRIRPAFQIDGQSLVEMDVSSAQPYILGLFIKQHLYNHRPPETNQGSKQESQGRSSSQGQRGFQSGQGGLSIYMSDVFTPSVQTTTDLLDYLDACESGTFYEEFAEALRMRCGTPAERKRVKRSWCYMTFGVHRPDSLRWNRYAARWPTPAEFLEKLKASDHCEAARFLQRLESDLMIRGVADHVRLHYPAIPIVTIHDGVLTTEANVEKLRQIILETWGSIHGKPKIKTG